MIYELHVGTFTPEGTYRGALEQARRTCSTSASPRSSCMPLADFAGRRNWGYDGVLPYAPDAAYGRPEDLKRLIDAAHALGLMVFLDVVYNHFGPDGNYLPAYAPRLLHRAPPDALGRRRSTSTAGAAAVRQFFVHNALYWLEEYHFDGLRFDAVHAILDDSPTPHPGRARRDRARAAPGPANPPGARERGEPGALARRTPAAAALARRAMERRPAPWLHVLADRRDATATTPPSPTSRSKHLARCLAEGFAYQGEPSPSRRPAARRALAPPAAVGLRDFLQNHDQVGNRAFGERLSHLADPGRLDLARAGLLLAPQIPMLWMGEEWSASTPFLFFVDFAPDAALNKAVREGRRREFKSFAAFADDTSVIPDPTEAKTFPDLKLDWSERERSPHREVLAETTRLLALAPRARVPLTKSAYLGATAILPRPDVVDCTWRFAGRNPALRRQCGRRRFQRGPGHRPPDLDERPARPAARFRDGPDLPDGRRGMRPQPNPAPGRRAPPRTVRCVVSAARAGPTSPVRDRGRVGASRPGEGCDASGYVAPRTRPASQANLLANGRGGASRRAAPRNPITTPTRRITHQ